MATPRMDITSFVGKLLEEDDVDLLREGVRVLAQALMETEVSSQIGAARPTSGAPAAPPTATGTAPGRGTLGSAPSSSRSPRSPRAPTSPPCSSPGGERRRPFTPWCVRPT
jgi:hypothetical protein